MEVSERVCRINFTPKRKTVSFEPGFKKTEGLMVHIPKGFLVIKGLLGVVR